MNRSPGLLDKLNDTNVSFIYWSVMGLTIALGFIFLVWWISYDPTKGFVESVPGMDNAPALSASTAMDAVMIGEYGESFGGVAANLPGAWPRFRGTNFDNISTEKAKLADKWGPDGPEILWSVALGEGHAAPAVLNGRVYLLDYDEEKKADALRCFSLDDGREIWRRWYHVRVKRNHGMSRTVPAVTDKYAITIGPRCHVMCVSADSGSFLWGIDLEKEFGTKVPFWYTGQCPLIDDSLTIIAPGGRALMIGVNCATGEVVWETPNPNGWQMSHSSIMPMIFKGKKMYVYCAVDGMFGVSAEGEDRGTVLWETTAWSHSVIAPSPIVLEDGRIFVTAGYGAGSMMLRLAEVNGTYSIEPLQELKPNEGFASEQQTPILFEGYLFGIMPKDAGALRNQFVSCHPDDCRRILWSSGKTNRFGLGPYLIADGKFFVLNDDGLLTLLKATASGYVQLDGARVFDGHDAWGPLALAGGRLLLRDSRRMVCVDVRKK